ncbi:glucose-6-phosphate isomerase 1, chloroplastic-like [Carex rostrata]
MVSISGAFSPFSTLFRPRRHQSDVISAFPLHRFCPPQSIADLPNFSSPLSIKPPSSPAGRFTQILFVGIRGSALGPQFVAEALAPDNPPLKSGDTPKIRNGLLEVQKAFRDAGLNFSSLVYRQIQ